MSGPPQPMRPTSSTGKCPLRSNSSKNHPGRRFHASLATQRSPQGTPAAQVVDCKSLEPRVRSQRELRSADFPVHDATRSPSKADARVHRRQGLNGESVGTPDSGETASSDRRIGKNARTRTAIRHQCDGLSRASNGIEPTRVSFRQPWSEVNVEAVRRGPGAPSNCLGQPNQ